LILPLYQAELWDNLRYEVIMDRTIEIWTTGAPVPGAQRARGSFFDMISAHTRAVFQGRERSVDVTVVDSRAAYSSLVNQESSGVIVTGSPAHVRQNAEWMKWTMDALIELDQRGRPILGICFGHQLLGQALGGQVDFNPQGREIGTYPLTFHADDPLLGGPGSSPLVAMTHLDSVVVRPARAQLVASTALDPHAALRFSATTWGVQFHPEMDVEIIGHYLSDRQRDIEAEGIDVERVRASLRESPYGASLLGRFAQFCHAGKRFLG